MEYKIKMEENVDYCIMPIMPLTKEEQVTSSDGKQSPKTRKDALFWE